MVQTVFTAAYAEIVEAVITLRKRAGLTQRELAERLGREQNLVGRIETRQRRIDLVEFVWICQACGADPEIEVAQLVRLVKRQVPQRRSRRGRS